MDSETVKLPIRLAIREEGTMVNAYIAEHGSIKNALLIGSIAVKAVCNNEERWNAFKQMMAGFVSELIEDATGSKPLTEEHSPPENEKPGNC